MGYITGIDALRYHGYDWHFAKVREDRYPRNVKEWSDFGVEKNIASPVRAFLDILYHYIVNLGILPPVRLEEYTFTEEEEQEIIQKVNSLLRNAFTDNERLKLLEEWFDYNEGKISYDRVKYGKRLKKLKRKAVSGKPFFSKPDTNITEGKNGHFLLQKLTALQKGDSAELLYDIALILEERGSKIPYSVKEEAYAVLSKLSKSFDDFLVIYGDLFSSYRLAFMRTMGRLEKFLSCFEVNSNLEAKETVEKDLDKNILPSS